MSAQFTDGLKPPAKEHLVEDGLCRLVVFRYDEVLSQERTVAIREHCPEATFAVRMRIVDGARQFFSEVTIGMAEVIL